jgi:membrane-bound inhibitor of C-type lysozyme
MPHLKRISYAAAAASALMMVQACSQPAPVAGSVTEQPSNAVSVVADAPQNLEPTRVGATAPPSGNSGFAPGEALAFEWSANGFSQVPSQFKWTGTGKDDDGFKPNFSLSVPETDDGIWSSSCASNGMVETQIYVSPPKNMANNRATFKFETDKSTRTLSYPAQYVSGGMSDGFKIIQNPSDPMFREMKAASWAYLQMGDGDGAVKLRVSLANASKSLNAFLPACSPRSRQVATPPPAPTPAPTPKTPVVSYNCEGGRTASATYLGNETDTPVVRLEIDGKVMLMAQAVAGSGARYESSRGTTGDKKYVWHSKGRGSLFIESNADDTDGSTETILRCQEP